MDNLSAEQRSHCMARIRSQGSQPERLVERFIKEGGYKIKDHWKALPSRPDFVLVQERKVVFVNGCYWHYHHCRYGRVQPRTNAGYWNAKRLGNRERDRRTRAKIRRLGWKVFVVWECWLRVPGKMEKQLGEYLHQG